MLQVTFRQQEVAMIVLLMDGDTGFRTAEVGVRDRLRVRRWASRLDVDLASGTSPESTLERAVHAQHLVAPSSRRSLARSIQRVQAAAAPGVRPRLDPVPLCHDRIRQVAAELETVRDRLLAGGPLPARGVAMLRLVLTNGSGPLYHRRSRDDLRSLLTDIATALGDHELDDIGARG
jgi:hypothetical protein